MCMHVDATKLRQLDIFLEMAKLFIFVTILATTVHCQTCQQCGSISLCDQNKNYARAARCKINFWFQFLRLNENYIQNK